MIKPEGITTISVTGALAVFRPVPVAMAFAHKLGSKRG